MKTLTIKDGTHTRLQERGKMYDSFDTLLNRLLDCERHEFIMQNAERLDAAFGLLLDADVDPILKARALFQGIGTAIKLFELGELDKRLHELEIDGKEENDNE